MKTSVTVSVVAVIMGCAALESIAADQPPASELATSVFKYVGTRMGSAAGHPTTMLQVALRAGGGQIEIGIPNNNPASMKLDSSTTAMNIIKELKPGDLVKVHYSKSQTNKMLDAIEKRAPQPGDDDPEALEFVALTEVKILDQNRPAVVIRKGAKEQTILVPGKKNAEGKLIADEEILSQARKFTESDYVDLEVAQADGNATIRSIRPYQPLKWAHFVKTSTDAKTSLATVELKEDEKPLLLNIRPAGAGAASDPALVAKARAFRAEQLIGYKAVEDGGKTWLTEIRPAPANQPMGEVTLNGTYSMGQPPNNKLKVVLKSSGPGEWAATYSFSFNDPALHTYTGTVKGNLQNGPVAATAKGEGRTFGFKGQASGGVLSFDCFETTGPGGQQVVSRGTGTLK